MPPTNNAALDEAFPDETAAPAPADSASALNDAFPDAPAPTLTKPKKKSDIDELLAKPHDIDELIHGAASGMYHSVKAGYKGLYTLATTRDPDAAADAVNAETAQSYQPDLTPQMRAALKITPSPMQIPAKVGQALGNLSADNGGSPALSTLAEVVPQAIPMLASAVPGRRAIGEATARPLPDAQGVVSSSAARQSMGAASAGTDISAASPALKAGIQEAGATGAPINQEVLQRHMRADQFGINLTEGQATRDEGLYTEEQNSAKAGNAPVQKALRTQDDKLVSSLDDIRQEASPSSVQNGPVEHGKTLMDAYKEYDEPIKADVSAKYKALADANGGDLPVDGNSYVSAADAALKKQNKQRYLPAEVRATLDDLREGGEFSFNNFENLRTDLAAAARKADRAGDGNAKAAINIARSTLEDLPMTGANAKMKALADEARTAARSRFEAIESDPAYEASVNDDVKKGQTSTQADKFLDKYVMGAPQADVAKIQEKFSGNPDVQEALRGHALNVLKEKAGISSQNEGFKQYGFNNQITALDKTRKLDMILGPELAQKTRDLGAVAHDIQKRPAASGVNESNTAGALAKNIGAMGAHLIDLKTTGGLIGKARGLLPDRTQEKLAERALKPGAGLSYPSK